MNILFVTLLDIRSIHEHNIYADMMREFAHKGNNVYVVSPIERRYDMPTQLIVEADPKYETVQILKLRTGNIQKTNVIEKGISTILLEYQMLQGLKKYFKEVYFDLVIFSTPPITLVKPIRYIKKRDKAMTYLLLKDIFPQNAIDLGMIQKIGVKGMLYKFFRMKEKKIYALADRIGCMSQANVDYVLKHNPEIDPAKMEVCPNAIEVQDMSVSAAVRAELRQKYGIPQNKKVFVYGGNLGRPQGIPFLLQCLENQRENQNAYFLIVGDGTEYKKMEAWFSKTMPENARLLKQLPKEDYDRLVAACDVGMIFLDHRFTIPNFPSRLLSYLQAKLPVLCCTDPNTDIGKLCEKSGFGFACESNDPAAFDAQVSIALEADLLTMGKAGFDYLNQHYTAEKACRTILQKTCVSV